MHDMNKFCLILFLGFGLNCITNHSFGQQITIAEGARLTVSESASLTLNELTFTPSVTLMFSGDRQIKPVEGMLVANGIDKYYDLSKLLVAYQGTLSFHYQEDELKGIAEEDLHLYLKNENDIWQVYQPQIDADRNTLSYTFADPRSFSQVSLADHEVVTSIDHEESIKIVAFPNTVKETLHLQSTESILSIQLLRADGSLSAVMDGSNRIDLSQYPSWTYLINLRLVNDETKTIKIIKKN